jgi:hypothetical protein
MARRHDAADLARLTRLIDRWAAREQDGNPLVTAVDHDPAERRWCVRLRGEDKAVITVWLTLRERTLHAETYFMPAPEADVEACYEYLLRANARLYGLAFAIGPEDAVYLRGQTALDGLDEDELDRIVGSCWAWSEQHLRPAMSRGYGARFLRSS